MVANHARTRLENVETPALMGASLERSTLFQSKVLAIKMKRPESAEGPSFLR